MTSATLDPSSSAHVFKHLGAQGFAIIELDAEGNVLGASSNALELFGTELCSNAVLKDLAWNSRRKSGKNVVGSPIPLNVNLKLGNVDVQGRAKLLPGGNNSTFVAIETGTLRRCQTRP